MKTCLDWVGWQSCLYGVLDQVGWQACLCGILDWAGWQTCVCGLVLITIGAGIFDPLCVVSLPSYKAQSSIREKKANKHEGPVSICLFFSVLDCIYDWMLLSSGTMTSLLCYSEFRNKKPNEPPFCYFLSRYFTRVTDDKLE